MDDPPETWNGYKVNTDLAVGIKLSKCLMDDGLGDREKLAWSIDILFADDFPREPGQVIEAIKWFLNGWDHDRAAGRKRGKEEVGVMDLDVDSWRIHAAFLSQYGIDLSKESLHFWTFMGLLSSLDECAFTRVIEIRQVKVTAGMSKKEKERILKAKETYCLSGREASDTGTDTEEEREARKEAIEAFNRMRRKA